MPRQAHCYSHVVVCTERAAAFDAGPVHREVGIAAGQCVSLVALVVAAVFKHLTWDGRMPDDLAIGLVHETSEVGNGVLIAIEPPSPTANIRWLAKPRHILTHGELIDPPLKMLPLENGCQGGPNRVA